MTTPVDPLFQAFLEQARLADEFLAAGRFADARQLIGDLLLVDPANAVLHLQLGACCHALLDYPAARAALERAVALDPLLADGWADLGAVLQTQRATAEAEAAFRRALQLDPGHPQALLNLGHLLRDKGRLMEARQCYSALLEQGHYPLLAIRLATLLPAVYASSEEAESCFANIHNKLAALEHQSLSSCLDPIACGGGNAFYLAYQGRPVAAYQRRIAALYRRMYDPPYKVARKPSKEQKRRVAFVSAFLREHTIGHLLAGVISRLPPDRFDVFVLLLGAPPDDLSQQLAAGVQHFEHLPGSDVNAIAGRIAALQLDVLVYADIGMEPVSYFLAFNRLAPVQAVLWGHPVTTGIDTVDYYVSSEAQETPGSEAEYSEQLVRLPRLLSWYEAPPQVQRSAQDFGLNADSFLYVCPQSLFKFHPDFDVLLRQILLQDPSGYLVLMQGHQPEWTEQLQARFSNTLPDVFDRIVWLPRLAYAEYLGLLTCAHVMLDPLYFGGGKTTLDALSVGLPVVTLPGRTMRSRGTVACCAQIGWFAGVAQSPDDYVKRAVALAREFGATERQALAELARGLQKDQLAVNAFADWLSAAAVG